VNLLNVLAVAAGILIATACALDAEIFITPTFLVRMYWYPSHHPRAAHYVIVLSFAQEP
jgi:hypothetical protein